jgi:uncharacterized protein YbjT (DUF2867 family)
MKVLLPGVAGFIGKAVLRHLLDKGHEVFGVVRSDRDKAGLPSDPGLKLMTGDVTRPQYLSTLLPDLDACIYLPGLLREFPKKGINFQSVHADGVKNLIEVAKAHGATRWIQMSALGVGRGHLTGYYDSKLKGEDHVKVSGMDWRIVRPSVVFSEEYDPRLNFVSELADLVRKAPVIPILGDGQYRLQPVALDILAKAMVDALQMPETFSRIYEVGGPEKLTYIEIIKTIASAQGMGSKPTVKIPFGPVKLMASLLDQYPFFPITRDQITMLQHENTVEDEDKQLEFEQAFQPRSVRFAEGVTSFFAGKP